MSSLFQMILETMPGEGALTVAKALSVVPFGTLTVGALASCMEYVEDSQAASLSVASPELSQADIDAAVTNDEAARRLPLWSYAASSLDEVNKITCRVRDEGYREYVVLDKLAFGSSPAGDPSQFSPCIRVTMPEGLGSQQPVELPLSEDFRVASFKTHNGVIIGGSQLWPLPSFQDASFLHVFVFDYNAFLGTVEPVTSRQPGDPDLVEFAKFRAAARRLRVGEDGGDEPVEVLYQDDLFQPVRPMSETGAVAEVVLSGGGLFELALAAASVRIVVVCSLTLCRERGDYSPGGAGGSARIYPHIMARSTVPLSAVLATVQMERPTKTTIVGGGSCSCSEMREEIRPLLVADADAANGQDVMPPLSPGPSPYWNSLFNYYYAVDTASDVFFKTPIHAVRAEKLSRDTADNPDGPSLIERRRARNKDRVTRTTYQGEFDNIHLAPRMSLKDAGAVEASGAPDQTLILVDPSDVAKWKLDSIPMAPFCVHDCFHMHWRWADFADAAQFGYAPFSATEERKLRPATRPGATMIPPNQDLWLWLTNASGFNYAGVAHQVPADEWQVFCHHGAGYAVHTGWAMNMARNLDELDFTIHVQGIFSDIPDGYAATGDASRVTLMDSRGEEIDPSVSWAAFYWHIHYFFDGSDIVAGAPEERVVIHDLSALRAF